MAKVTKVPARVGRNTYDVTPYGVTWQVLVESPLGPDSLASEEVVVCTMASSLSPPLRVSRASDSSTPASVESVPAPIIPGRRRIVL